MARQANRLTARTAATIAAPGRHADGNGLYLVVDASGARRWVFLFTLAGKRREMGLGSVSLVNARRLAAGAREAVATGINPIEQRKAGRQARDERKTFGECALAYIAAHEGSWRNAKHRAQWAMTLGEYAAPLRDKAVDEIDTEAVLAVLQPLWQSVPETASRLRGRIEAVLDAARAQGHRHGENPARWRGHLDHLLPKRQKLTRGHHAALPYGEVPAFVASLRDREAIAALALEFVILTAARSGEVLGARWSEFDLEAKVWTVPAARMKAGKAHRVPLSARAVAILQKLAEAKVGEFIFPGQKPGKPLSGMAMEMVLRRMKSDFVTVHGFRSSFRDWCGEETHFPGELAEAALAHVAGDETERAYRRGDALEKRRKLMEAWAGFCEPGVSGNVVRMRKATASG
jgi:integrase